MRRHPSTRSLPRLYLRSIFSRSGAVRRTTAHPRRRRRARRPPFQEVAVPHLPPARSATAPGPRPLSRRSFLGAAALGSLALGLSACGGPDVPQVRFYQSKPEAIPYFKNLLKTFNEQQDGKIEAIHDSASNLSSGFARADPPDLGCLNYNYEMARFQERGELSDLSDLQAEANIADSIQQLVD
ncbi:twin-arginine translocation signal domain-containing protein, partial [Amycolatopsis sp. H6(2020)]|nr:twin-arginine translocation signal domain-containing protein [Amycolatopsis sp. H6(2020)]